MLVKLVRGLFNVGYASIVVVFICSGAALIFFAGVELWNGINPNRVAAVGDRLKAILEGIGLATIAVVAFELGQTILEEELQRQAHIGTPTRVRRFLSRFMVVVVVALSIECLIAIFELVHKDTSRLPHAASVGVAAGILLVAWGCFVRLNRSAEELEPEAMAEAKKEDNEVK